MATIREYLREDLIQETLQGRSKEEILREFAELFRRAHVVSEPQELVDRLMAREKLGSTGIGDGIAIPHARVKNLTRVTVAFGRAPGGVDFNALDGKPTDLFFVLIAPEDVPGEHLKVLARLSRLLRNPVFRDALRRARGRHELYEIIAREDARS